MTNVQVAHSLRIWTSWLFRHSSFELRHFALMSIIKALKERAQIDGVILGGTELSLILRDDVVFGVQILDTTRIHVEAAVAQLLSGTG